MKKITSFLVLVTFILSCIMPPQGFAQTLSAVGLMSDPGMQVALSAGFTPAHLKGMIINPANPFQFDFLINPGDEPLAVNEKRSEYAKLIKYFLASLAVPDTDQWVNLSPYEKERVIPDNFGLTEMGRDLLAQDYMLKQIASTLTNPDTDLGKKFWDGVYAQAKSQLGTVEMPSDVFNKVWITPDKAVVYEKGNAVYVLEHHLKVLMESDYQAMKENAVPEAEEATALSKQVMREIIIPQIEKEVNEGKNFAPLRQVYSGMLLASWYKLALKESIIGKLYADQGKVKGVDQDPAVNQKIYGQYVQAFQKGVYNMIKEDVDPQSQEVVARKYFSGGTINDEGEQLKKPGSRLTNDGALKRAGDFAQKDDLVKITVQNTVGDFDNAMKETPVIGAKKKFRELHDVMKKWSREASESYMEMLSRSVEIHNLQEERLKLKPDEILKIGDNERAIWAARNAIDYAKDNYEYARFRADEARAKLKLPNILYLNKENTERYVKYWDAKAKSWGLWHRQKLVAAPAGSDRSWVWNTEEINPDPEFDPADEAMMVEVRDIVAGMKSLASPLWNAMVVFKRETTPAALRVIATELDALQGSNDAYAVRAYLNNSIESIRKYLMSRDKTLQGTDLNLVMGAPFYFEHVLQQINALIAEQQLEVLQAIPQDALIQVLEVIQEDILKRKTGERTDPAMMVKFKDLLKAIKSIPLGQIDDFLERERGLWTQAQKQAFREFIVRVQGLSNEEEAKLFELVDKKGLKERDFIAAANRLAVVSTSTGADFVLKIVNILTTAIVFGIVFGYVTNSIETYLGATDVIAPVEAIFMLVKGVGFTVLGILNMQMYKTFPLVNKLFTSEKAGNDNAMGWQEIRNFFLGKKGSNVFSYTPPQAGAVMLAMQRRYWFSKKIDRSLADSGIKVIETLRAEKYMVVKIESNLTDEKVIKVFRDMFIGPVSIRSDVDTEPGRYVFMDNAEVSDIVAAMKSPDSPLWNAMVVFNRESTPAELRVIATELDALQGSNDADAVRAYINRSIEAVRQYLRGSCKTLQGMELNLVMGAPFYFGLVLQQLDEATNYDPAMSWQAVKNWLSDKMSVNVRRYEPPQGAVMLVMQNRYWFSKKIDRALAQNGIKIMKTVFGAGGGQGGRVQIESSLADEKVIEVFKQVFPKSGSIRMRMDGSARMVDMDNAEFFNINNTGLKGGIDFAQSNLDLQIKRDGAGVPLPVSQQDLDNVKISGLVPVILSIQPAANVPLFTGAGMSTP